HLPIRESLATAMRLETATGAQTGTVRMPALETRTPATPTPATATQTGTQAGTIRTRAAATRTPAEPIRTQAEPIRTQAEPTRGGTGKGKATDPAMVDPRRARRWSHAFVRATDALPSSVPPPSSSLSVAQV